MASGWNKIFDIFDHSNQQMTTNDAACARLSEADAFCFQISEPIYRDLLRITRRDNLKVPLALQWASNHFVYLGNEGIQFILEHCFFAPNGLYDRLKEEPRFIESLREFVTKGLLYLRDNPNHLPTLLFLLSLGVFFETNFSEIYGPEKSQQMLRGIRKGSKNCWPLSDWEESQKYELNLHWILVSTQRTQRSDSEEIALLLSIFKFRKEYHSITYRWLTERLRRIDQGPMPFS